ncbi:MAG: 16S rRNA (adenine(1518)-N(6)/adenine(1519)-N(6))-dimethyltransferase RsmA [Minisyncoccia bacterium]
MEHKKSLGQNFLNSQKIAEDIVGASKTDFKDVVLEIGPGEGILTRELLKTVKKVVAVEKDSRLIPVLTEKFNTEIKDNKLALIYGDILNFDLSKIVFDTSMPRVPLGIGRGYKVVANIPYYITGQILRKFLEAENKPESMTLLVQKEVAERIVAKDKKESLLSLSVKIYGKPNYVKTVSKAFFAPQPKVDSAILHISNIVNHFPKVRPLGNGKERFFDLIHAGFAHKRKQLFSNLCQKYDRKKILKAFEALKIPMKIRAEDLPLEVWTELCKNIE